MKKVEAISVQGAFEHNLKGFDVTIERQSITVVTGVSGSGKSSLAFDTVLAEAQRRFFYTLSHYTRQFLDMGSRPAVRNITGLSPAIALAQNETKPSQRATVGTLTDISELLGVLFARFGEQSCPQHGHGCAAQTLDSVIERVFEIYGDQNVAIFAPFAEKKKGNFRTRLVQFAERGFLRAAIDGKVVSLNPVPELNKEQKHTIKILVDVVKVSEKSRERLVRSLKTAMDVGEGIGELCLVDGAQNPKLDQPFAFSLQAGCPECGFTWPKMDSRYFSTNSLGRCEACDGYGVVDISDEELAEEGVSDLSLDVSDAKCSECMGTGLNPQMQGIRIGRLTPREAHLMELRDLDAFIAEMLRGPLGKNPAFERVGEQICVQTRRLLEVGLDYLSISRRIRSLSGGEAQRLKLAGVLGENLRGVLYVLDEPSQGLHPHDLTQLLEVLKKLRDQGNTIIIVDHDEQLMMHADWIIDLGPTGGREGGHLLAKFRPSDAAKYVKQSQTAAHLVRPEAWSAPSKRERTTDMITITRPRLHNLRMDQVSFPKGRMSAITGVSGAGKSSLVLATLFENMLNYLDTDANQLKHFKFRYCDRIDGIEDFERVELIDRSPIAKSSIGMPASYLDVFSELRKLYEQHPDAQILGVKARDFSLQVEGGRCEECRGRGEMTLSMRFLADARVRCHVCNGQRYRPHVLAVKYHGLSMADVLNLSIAETYERFKNFRLIQKRLHPAIELGLGYLKLGQPMQSLSGGEAQRLKLTPYFAKNYGPKSLLILDEPTTGLHAQDIQGLVKCLKNLVEQGATILVVEHHAAIISACDWVVDIGPGASREGGQLLYSGEFGKLSSARNSITAQYIQHH